VPHRGLGRRPEQQGRAPDRLGGPGAGLTPWSRPR